MKERKNEKGYNRDGEMGPFFDAVYDEAPFLCSNEVEEGVDLLEPVPEIPPPATVIMHADIDKLK